jgi:hypothetical protein
MGYHNILLKCESIINNDIIEVKKCATQKTSIQWCKKEGPPIMCFHPIETWRYQYKSVQQHFFLLDLKYLYNTHSQITSCLLFFCATHFLLFHWGGSFLVHASSNDVVMEYSWVLQFIKKLHGGWEWERIKGATWKGT